MSVNNSSVEVLLKYISKCVDNTLTQTELSSIQSLPDINVNKESMLQIKYYFLGWYIYNLLDKK